MRRPDLRHEIRNGPLHAMYVAKTLSALRQARSRLQGDLGLVPTMGFLHPGHLSLVDRARVENDHLGVSIFVNPSQFGPNEDLASYPRDTERDLGLLERAGVDLVWLPEAGEVYPAGFQTWVEVGAVAQPLEGERRPGHFRGVATVVAKLFHLFSPRRAYFGQKDAQQVAVLRRMVLDLNFPLEIVVCPTLREPDGVAMSSRNTYLSPQERQAATVLRRALMQAHAVFAAGEGSGDVLRGVMAATVGAEPLARLDYVSVADAETLQELDQARPNALLSMAVFFGSTRLIDNLVLAGS